MTEVFERVLLGNRHDACDVVLFNQQNIGLVVNVTDNINNHFEGCSQVKRRIPKNQQTQEMISLSQSSTGEVIFDEEGRNITPTKQSQELLENPLFFDDESNSSMCETPMKETLFTSTTSVTDYLMIPSQVSDSSDLSSIPSDPMLTFDDENSIMSSVSATENNDPLLIDQTSISSIREEASNSSQTPQKSQDEPIFATPKSKAKTTPKKSSQKKERKQAAKVYEYVKLNHSVMYHKIAIEDSHEVKIADYFDDAISKIVNFLENHPNMKVMIHCREGKSRSVSTLIAYGMKSLKLSLNDCYNHVTKKLHGNDRINDGFKRQLMEYELDLLTARSSENPEIEITNSLNFFQKRGRYAKSYALNEDHDDDEDVDYDEEDDVEEDEDDEDGDYEEKKRKPKKKTGGRKKKGPQFVKDWKDIDIQEAKPQKGKQLSLFDMFAKKNKPAPTVAAEPAQPSKQATLDSLFSPKKPKKSSTKKTSSAKKLYFDNLPQEATIPPVKETHIDATTEPIVLVADDKMDTSDDMKVVESSSKSESSVSTSENEKPEIKDGKKKKKEKDQNKSTKKVFKRAPRFPTPEEPAVEEPKEESKKRKKTEDSESKTESKKKKTKKEKTKKEKKAPETSTDATPSETKPSSDENTSVVTEPTTTVEQTIVEEKPKKVAEKPKTGGLFKYFKPKAVTTTNQ